MKKKDKKRIKAIEQGLNVKFPKEHRKFILEHEDTWQALIAYRNADFTPQANLPMAKLPLAHNAFAPEDFGMPDAPTPVLVTAVKRSTHPTPRALMFDWLDRAHAKGTHIGPEFSQAVIKLAVSAGVTPNTARSLVHIWRKQNGLSKTLNKGAK